MPLASCGALQESESDVVVAEASASPVGAGGGVASTVQEAVAAPTLPTASAARTANVCAPSASPVSVRGLVHAAKAAPSRLHVNAVAPAAANDRVAPVALVTPDGAPESVTSGGVVSTVHSTV